MYNSFIDVTHYIEFIEFIEKKYVNFAQFIIEAF